MLERDWITDVPKTVVEGDHTMEGGMKAMYALAVLPDRPSAAICSNDMTAIGVMRQVFELGVNVPSELSVVGFDDIHLAQFTTPPLTTVHVAGRNRETGLCSSARLGEHSAQWNFERGIHAQNRSRDSSVYHHCLRTD
jgi:Periplasmic binding protein-like domain